MLKQRLRNQPGKKFTSTLITLSIFFFIVIFSGCVSSGPTKPNEVYPGEYPAIFENIKKQNSLLAEEIGKLPELQDGIQGEEQLALKVLCDVYKKNAQLLDGVFIQMNSIGLPEIRKYCSPLQALFWIARKGDSKKIEVILTNYSLENLLSHGWDFNPPIMTDAEISEIIEDISDSKLRQQYLSDRKTCTNQQIQRLLLIDYRLNEKVFSKRSKKLLAAKNSSNHPHWSDFNTVLLRLNSPELVNYYEQDQIQWVDWRSLPTWPVSTSYVFQHGQGDCTAIANFTALCLRRAGYKAYEYKVAPRRPVDAHHSICVFFVDNTKYVMDNGSPLKKGILLYEEY